MGQAYSIAARRSPEALADLYQDETLAMVYVGDVYSLVAQSGLVDDATSKIASSDDHGTLWPFIR